MTMEKRVELLNRILMVAKYVIGALPMITTFMILINGFTTENIIAAAMFSAASAVLAAAVTVIVILITALRITSDPADFMSTISVWAEEAKKGE